MNNVTCGEDERIDDLQRNGYRIIQKKKGFCFGMDAVLLSGFAQVKEGEAAVDLGTGTGIIPILLEAKTKGKHFTGLEIQEEVAEMAERSVRLNQLEDTVNPQQMLWGINQGGTYTDLRIRHMQQIAELDLPGYAIGGLAVGESTEVMYDIIEALDPYMPRDKTRYLMGVGTPSNIIEGVARGVDFFDCVMPARNARHAKLFTWSGTINLKNVKYERDERPIDAECDCPVCRRYSRAYLRHLFKAEEMLAMRLSVMHNLYFYNKLTERIRNALDEGSFESFRRTYSVRLAQRAED